MIHHTSVGVTDYEKAKALYGKMLEPLGYALGMDMPEFGAGGFKQGDAMDFWIGQKEKVSGMHVAFSASSKEMVQAFYHAALDAGASGNGEPGYRKDYTPGYYAAFVHDLDGNNIEAVWMDPSVKA